VISIHQRYRQTDRQTDRRTDGRTSCDGITAPLLVAWSGKNALTFGLDLKKNVKP